MSRRKLMVKERDWKSLASAKCQDNPRTADWKYEHLKIEPLEKLHFIKHEEEIKNQWFSESKKGVQNN